MNNIYTSPVVSGWAHGEAYIIPTHIAGRPIEDIYYLIVVSEWAHGWDILDYRHERMSPWRTYIILPL